MPAAPGKAPPSTTAAVATAGGGGFTDGPLWWDHINCNSAPPPLLNKKAHTSLPIKPIEWSQ